MQSDSVQFSTFEHIKESSSQVVAPSNPVRSYNCIKCPLIFKSKVYLYEHLNKVHCLDVKDALKGAGLKYAESNTASAENRRSFKCHFCDFKTFHKDTLKKHEKQCQKTENHNFIETVVIPEDPESEVLGSSTNQCNDTSLAETDPLSGAKCEPKMSKDLKTYKRPQQTITKFFPASSQSSSCSPSSSGVCKFRARSFIDISGNDSNKFLRNDELLTTNHSAPERDRYKELHNNSSISESPPAKKVKLGKELATFPEKNAYILSPVSTDFSFEVSEDEEDKKLHLYNKDPSKPKVYTCKHCDYIDGSFSRMTSHYHNSHPYIRCSAAYIQLPNDQDASFRCLECPVEFLSKADLKLHYSEKHPEAADVFKMKLDELNLVFKCFSCPFTTNLLKALREHYKEKHPSYNLNKPLLFCQYSKSKCQDEPTPVKTHEKTSSSRGLSPEKTSTSCKEYKHTQSPQHSTANERDLYKCSNCEFMHKSAVVMHVHYQKRHPDKAVTIDKIKQSARDSSRRIPEKKKDKPELFLQKKSLLSSPKHTTEASKKPSEVSTTKPVESVQDKTTTTTPSSKCSKERIAGLGNKSSSSSAKMYYCRFCSYTNSEIRSVLGHHFARHSMKQSITMKDILLYSATVRKKLMKGQTQSKARKQSKISTTTETGFEGDGAKDVSVNQTHASSDAEKMFFCQTCNYGNASLQGVINHQIKAHPFVSTKVQLVIKHTALIQEQLNSSNSNRKGSTSSMHLPLPILNYGDENKFFCDLCNYRHTTMAMVLSHYSKMHHSCADKAADLHQYTAMVLERAPKSSTNQEQPKKTEKKKSSEPAEPLSVSALETQRKLKCYVCEYSTQYVSLLKTHLRKSHNLNRKVSHILGFCFRQGAIEAGYHCIWCVFGHKNSKVVYKHYQEHHPERTTSLDYVRNQLCVGLNKVQLTKKKPKLQSADLGKDTDSSRTHKSSRQNDSETYSCTMCSFQSSSKSGLTCHKNEAHPTLAEDNKSDHPKNKATSAKSQLEDLNEMPGVFESFQVPLEDKDEVEQISKEFKCSSCSATFISQHGLSIHCGMKHLELINAEEPKKQAKSQIRVHVFKCPHCTYVNTSYHGILAHCQMKHPDVEPRAASLHIDLVDFYNRDKYIKKYESGEMLKLKGHMCKTCPKVCATLDKLNSHCELDHNNHLPSTPKPAAEPSAVSKIKLTKPHSSNKSAWKVSFLSKTKKYRMKCQHCSYTCFTKLGLSRHMQKQHMDMVSQDNVYKCPLCHLFYFRQHLLGRHLAKRHGKAAYLKYYLSVYKQATMMPVSPSQDPPSPQNPPSPQDHPSPQQQENDSSEDKKLVYKCPKCPYVNVSHHGVITHCQMKHPLFERRTRKLEMCEILVSNIVECSTGKGTYERGFLCKKCPQIYPSLIKLKAHCKMAHREFSDETAAKSLAVDDPPGSTPEAASIETAQANVTAASHRFGTSKTSDSLSQQKKDKRYKCQLCAHATFSRAYLWKHYKNVHKLNSATRCKLLQKYNKRLYVEHKKTFKCKKCPDLVWDSSQSLIDHFNTFHGLAYKSDFTVISFGLKRKTTGVYTCAHCLKKLNGTRNLRVHLDHHRAAMKKMVVETQEKASPVDLSSDPNLFELYKQAEVSATESVEDLAEQKETSEEDTVRPSSPRASTSKVTEADPDAEVTSDRLPCKQCHRFFRSLKGLRAHERSHAVMAAIKNLDNLPTAELKHDIKKCIFYKAGTTKPFRCSCCPYKTNLMGLVQSHILKNHQDILQRNNIETSSNDEEFSQEVERELSDSSEKNNLPELDDEPEETEETLYLEPADVQRQLNHYSLMAQIRDKTSTNVLELTLPENCLLQCEICNFNTEHLSSIRRHYLNRHGKKMLRCKDCEFYTWSRKTLEMHVQMGHSSCQSEPTHQKDLRCPFCLYQTKNKNNMIDHIVLHREERVVPVEVRRPKLSRYLQGIVFRCHRCTFSSGSDKGLRLHMMRHDDLKPYQCRLCYYDCTQLAELEAHLSDKHQVLRNHELVGQVNLEHLEARIGRMLEKNDEFNTDNEEVETEEFSSDFDETPQTNSVAEYDNEGKTVPPSEEAQEEQEPDENEESPSSNIQHDNTLTNTTVLKNDEQDLKAQVNVALHVSAEGQVLTKMERNLEECNDEDALSEGYSAPEKEEQTDNHPSKLTCEQKEKAESSSCFRMAGLAHAHKLHIKELQHRSRSIDAKIEDNIVRHVLLLDESDSKSNKWENQKQAVKTELSTEAKNRDYDASDDASLDKEDSDILAQNPRLLSISAKTDYAQVNNTRTERHLQTHTPSYKQLKLSFNDVRLTNCKQEQKQTPDTCMGTSEPCREMPVLEKECHIEEQQLLETCKEEEETDKLELKQEEEVEMTTEDKKQEMSDINNGNVATTDKAAEVLCTEKPFTCDLCGRNFTDIAELNRHVLRHRL